MNMNMNYKLNNIAWGVQLLSFSIIISLLYITHSGSNSSSCHKLFVVYFVSIWCQNANLYNQIPKVHMLELAVHPNPPIL